MKASKYDWLFGIVLIAGLIIIPLVIFLPGAEKDLSAVIPGKTFPCGSRTQTTRISSRAHSKPALMSPGPVWNAIRTRPRK